MAHHVQMKGVRKSRGVRGGGVSRARANRGQKRKVLPREVLLGEKPLR